MANKVTPIAAARRIAAAYRELGYEATVWSKGKCRDMGYSPNADAAVVCEGAKMADDQVWERGPWADCPETMQPFNGIFVEPYSEWLMCFYERGSRLGELPEVDKLARSA